MASKQNSNSAQNSSKNRVIYSEFGQNTDSAALERAKPDLPPAQQNLKGLAKDEKEKP
jgi:translation initiation factor 1